MKNALGRARHTLSQHPQGGDPADVSDRTARDPAARQILADWVDAFEKGNTPRMVALLTDEKSGYNLKEKAGTDVKETP